MEDVIRYYVWTRLDLKILFVLLLLTEHTLCSTSKI